MWTAAYERARDAPDRIGDIACPTCGAHTLNLVFVLFRPSARAGQGAFWCGTCQWGLAGLRAPLPPGVRTTLAGQEDFPDFRLVVED